MSAVAVLGQLKNYVKLKPSRADVSNIIFKTHRFTAALLAMCSILTTSKQFFGESINCMLGGGSIPIQVFQSYCFMSGTYTLPMVSSNVSSVYSGVSTGYMNAGGAEDGTVHHNYYQWVPLLLAFQACLSYFPWQMWKGVEGGKVGKLLSNVSQDPLTEITLSEQIISLSEFLISHRGWFDSCARKLRVWQIMCLILSVGQMYAMDLVLGYEYWSLGQHLFSYDLLQQNLAKVFPIVVKCSMTYVGPSGNFVNNSGLCTLPINIINEKIYMTLWFWFLLVTILSVLVLVYEFLKWMLPTMRHMKIQRLSPSSSSVLVKNVVDKCSYGDVVLLDLIANNVDSVQFETLLSNLDEVVSSLPLHQPSQFLNNNFDREENLMYRNKEMNKNV